MRKITEYSFELKADAALIEAVESRKYSLSEIEKYVRELQFKSYKKNPFNFWLVRKEQNLLLIGYKFTCDYKGNQKKRYFVITNVNGETEIYKHVLLEKAEMQINLIEKEVEK